MLQTYPGAVDGTLHIFLQGSEYLLSSVEGESGLMQVVMQRLPGCAEDCKTECSVYFTH